MILRVLLREKRGVGKPRASGDDPEDEGVLCWSTG